MLHKEEYDNMQIVHMYQTKNNAVDNIIHHKRKGQDKFDKNLRISQIHQKIKRASTSENIHKVLKNILLSIVIGAIIFPGVASAATKLFSSGFENGVVIGAPIKQNGQWIQHIKGKDSSGFDWSSNFPVKKFNFQYHVSTGSTLSQYASTSIKNVIGHNGKPTRALYQEVLKDDPRWGVARTRNQAWMETNNNNLDQLYVSYWIKLKPNMKTWRNIMEWRFGDYRWYILINNDVSRWDVVAEKENSRGYIPDWRQSSSKVPKYVNDKWFKLEIFWKLSAGSDGIVKVAIDGNTVISHKGRNRLSNNDKPQYHLFKAYSGSGNIYQYIDDVEIWNNVPCANFPCGNVK